MNASKFLPAVALASFLACNARPALADGVASPPPYRRPAQLEQPVELTAQSHLKATQSALQVALDILVKFDGPDTLDLNAIAYGGQVGRAREDLAIALTIVGEAAAFVRAHPETNPLAAGPVPAGEPPSPPMPEIRGQIAGRSFQGIGLAETVDALGLALSLMVNNPARDYHGPILDAMGGSRAKVIAAIARVGQDINQGLAYFQNVRGGTTGIITLSATGNNAADPKYGPTARSYLTQVKPLIDRLARNLTEPHATFLGDLAQGGYVAKVDEDLKRVATDLTAAVAYLEVHPEADALHSGSAGPEPSTVRPAAVPRWTLFVPIGAVPPSTAPAGGKAAARQAAAAAQAKATPRLNGVTVQNMNTTLGWLLNNPAPDYHGPILGELGGFRGKLMDDLGLALADTLAGIDYTLNKDPAFNPFRILPTTSAAAPARDPRTN